jgi:RNA polymerase sigma-70 factor, ECF subfamily
MPPQDRNLAPLRLVSPVVDDVRHKDLRHKDVELVAALRDGAAWASEAIWDRHSDTVSRFFVRSLGRSTADVEDLTQEVFLRVFTRPSAIREPAALREFVIAVAVRVLKGELRYRWIRRWVRLSDSGQLPDGPAAPDSDEAARHALKRCYAILDDLSARERAAFVLRYLEEMTVSEVAARMTVSHSTAKRVINRAAAKVSERVGRDVDLKTFFLDAGGRSFGER